MTRQTASMTLAVKLSEGQREYIGQIENSVPEFCVQSTQKERDVVSRVTRHVR